MIGSRGRQPAVLLLPVLLLPVLLLPVLLLAPVVVAARPCRLPRNVVVTQTGAVRFGNEPAVATAMSLPDANDERVRLLVRDGRCRTLWDETRAGLEARFDARVVGGTTLVEFVSMRVFGDGTDYTHEILVRRGAVLAPAVSPIDNTGKDGFFLGHLRSGGEGIVTWVADPSDASEAAPHPYIVSTWPWRGDRFGAASRYETTRTYLASDTQVPRSNVVARAMGLPYRDQTGTRRFMDPARVMNRLDALEEDVAE